MDILKDLAFLFITILLLMCRACYNIVGTITVLGYVLGREHDSGLSEFQWRRSRNSPESCDNSTVPGHVGSYLLSGQQLLYGQLPSQIL